MRTRGRGRIRQTHGAVHHTNTGPTEQQRAKHLIVELQAMTNYASLCQITWDLLDQNGGHGGTNIGSQNVKLYETRKYPDRDLCLIHKGLKNVVFLNRVATKRISTRHYNVSNVVANPGVNVLGWFNTQWVVFSVILGMYSVWVVFTHYQCTRVGISYIRKESNIDGDMLHIFGSIVTAYAALDNMGTRVAMTIKNFTVPSSDNGDEETMDVD